MKQGLISIIVVALLLGAISFGNGASAQDTNYARRIVRDLSSVAMHGRGASYRGDSTAAEYIRRELRRFKVQPLGDNFYQRYTYNTFAMEGQCWVQVNGKRLKNYTEFRVAPWSERLNREEIEVIELPLETFLDSEKLQRFIAKRKKTLAECFIYLNVANFVPSDDNSSNQFKQDIASLRRRNPFGSKGIILGVKQLSTASLGNCEYEHGYTFIEALASAMPKRVSTLNVSVNTQFRKDYHTQNVCGIIPGESDTMVVYTAHYDHLGTMGDGYKYLNTANDSVYQEGAIYFPGAHDNASGVAAVLDLVRMISSSKPHYTTVFFFFSGEEAGLKGSTYESQHPLIDFSKVKLLLNIDMFCGGEEGLMVFNANSANTKPFFDRLITLNQALQIAPEIRPRPNSPNSDHWPFNSLCPAMFVLTMGQPYGGYHDPADRCEACGLQYYENYLLLLSSLTEK